MAVQNVNESLAQMLECPVCFNQMEPPIELCTNGHNLCAGCKSQLSECPICKGTFSNVRNRALEAITESYLYACPNQDAGCGQKMLLTDRARHVKVCPHRLYECLPRRNDGCEWQGKFSELYTHMSTAHPELLTYEEFPAKIHFFTKLAVEGIRLAKLDGDLFWIHIRQDPAISKYFRAVQYIGPVEKASKYEYSYEFDLMDESSSCITYKRKVYSELDNMRDEFDKNANISHLLSFVKQCGYEKESVICFFNIRKSSHEE